MSPLLIGLTGPAGVGKDTVGSFLALLNYRRYAFAGPLKEALAAVGIHEPADRLLKEELLPGRSYSFRKAAQTLGTEWARNLDPDFWMNLAATNIDFKKYTVVTDVRFENEATFIRQRGGEIWHIEGRSTTVKAENASHVSEKPVLRYPQDKVLVNDKDLVYLRSLVFTTLR